MNMRFSPSEDDIFWCTEGCFPVEENHRCEQWSQARRIPAAVRQELVDSAEQKLERVLRIDTPFPLPSIVETLVDAARHLRTTHNCDRVGHERDLYAIDAAEAWLKTLPENLWTTQK